MGAGPQPNFHPYDVFRTLQIIATMGPIGRHLLRKEVELTECSVRTILRKLMSHGHIESNPQGQSLSKKGSAYVASLPYFHKSFFIDAGNLSLGAHDFVIVTKKDPSSLTNAIAQRDEAIKIGGDGATIIVYADGKLSMPPGFMDLEDEYPNDAARLLEVCALDDGDIVVIGSGQTKRFAQLAAMAAFDSL